MTGGDSWVTGESQVSDGVTLGELSPTSLGFSTLQSILLYTTGWFDKRRLLPALSAKESISGSPHGGVARGVLSPISITATSLGTVSLDGPTP